MPRQLIRQTLTITGGGTHSLSTTEAVDVYVIEAAGVTLASNLEFTYSGNQYEGLYYFFEYRANIDVDGNTITFFGTAMPDRMANDDCRITAYYNGSTWEVQFQPSLDEVGVIGKTMLEISPYVTVDYSAGASSTATLSEETLATVEVPADLFVTNGDSIKIIATGRTQANADTKTIRVRSNEPTMINPQQTYITNSVTTAPNGLDFKVEVNLIRSSATNGIAHSYIQFNGIAPELDTVAATAAYTFEGGANTFKFIFTTQQGTATANNVVLDQISIYKMIQ